MKKTKRISRNTDYIRGRAFEYRVKRYYEKMGYYVKRSYASKGAEDLCAIRRDFWNGHSEVLHIQCKNYKIEKANLSKTEVANLKALVAITGGKALYVYNDKNHKLVVKEIV